MLDGHLITMIGYGGFPLFLQKWRKFKFQSQNVPLDISEKNETEVMPKVIFRTSSNVNG